MWTILALLLLVPGEVGWAQTVTPSASTGGWGGAWMPRWLTMRGRSHEVKKVGPAQEPQPAPVSPLLSPRAAEAKRQAELDKWTRRVDVCDKLRKIALDTGDEELQRKADFLDQKAWEAYQNRTGVVTPPSSAVAVQNEVDYIGQYLRRQALEDIAKPAADQRVRANLEEQP